MLLVLCCVLCTIFCNKAEANAVVEPEDPNFAEKVRNVGYFLRSHKFNEYDRRTKNNITQLYAEFPKPPLFELHPEVERFCSEGKLHVCLQYLYVMSQVQRLRYSDDTATLIQQQGWTMDNDKSLIDKEDATCRRLHKEDHEWHEDSMFEGPLERFQWRTTASYYMCWFTMKELPALAHFGEVCDNFASCLHPEFGAHNYDPRANDAIPFACARYSFCPDPCCPEKHVYSLNECTNSPRNPCVVAAMDHSNDARLTKPSCNLTSNNNQDLKAIQLNHWNLSCPCPDIGYEWSSRFSACVDIDECSRGEETVRKITESCGGPEVSACLNMPGSAYCVCRWGFTKNERSNKCMPDLSLQSLLQAFRAGLR